MTGSLPNAYTLAAFIGLPYVAAALLFVVTLQRYLYRRFTYSSLSSQFLENDAHFWALVPFHYGLLGVLGLHAIALCVPSALLDFTRAPVRLYLLEATGSALGLLAILGIAMALIRRTASRKVFAVTSPMDWILLALLLVQVTTGLFIAVFKPWGYPWFSAIVTPYLWSLFRLDPDIPAISVLPWLVQLHLINAFLLVALFPFTRLVHLVVAPLPYLWRRPQVVRWYAKPGPRLEDGRS